MSQTAPALTPRRIKAEVWIVLGLSLGQSGVYALVSLIGKLTAGPLKDQTATLNASRSSREYLDLAYQLLGVAFALVPVVLAIYLLAVAGDRPKRVLGLGLGRPWSEVAWGTGLSALIGVPGLALYLIGRELGFSATVVASALNDYWWTVPVLIVAALQNAILEEVVVVGYLMTRLRQLRWSRLARITTSAAVRASYHLYQGFGAGVGNFVMGLVFGYFYERFGRVIPLVIAHTILDVVAFVGYALFKDALGLP